MHPRQGREVLLEPGQMPQSHLDASTQLPGTPCPCREGLLLPQQSQTGASAVNLSRAEK